jgi:hypothetical protein
MPDAKSFPQSASRLLDFEKALIVRSMNGLAFLLPLLLALLSERLLLRR